MVEMQTKPVISEASKVLTRNRKRQFDRELDKNIDSKLKKKQTKIEKQNGYSFKPKISKESNRLAVSKKKGALEAQSRQMSPKSQLVHKLQSWAISQQKKKEKMQRQ